MCPSVHCSCPAGELQGDVAHSKHARDFPHEKRDLVVATCLLTGMRQGEGGLLYCLASDGPHGSLCTALQDGFGKDGKGTQYRVLNGVIETPPGRDCYGLVTLYQNMLRIQGFGDFASQDLALPGADQADDTV